MSITDNRDRRYTWAYALLFGFSCSINWYYTHFVISPLDTLDSDMLVYIELAINFFYGYAPIEPYNTISLPGINYFYGIFFKIFGIASGFEVINAVQALILAGINVLVGLTTYELFQRRRAAFVVAVAVTLYWPFLGLISYYMAELMDVFLILLGQYALIRVLKYGGTWDRLVSIGIVLGLGMMMKGQAVVAFVAALLVIVLLPVGLGRRRWAAYLLVGFMLPIGLQMTLHHKINPASGWYMALVDSYNFYLAQSRRHGIGALYWMGPASYVFHTYANDTNDERRFLPLAIEEASILDRSYYKQRSWELIRTQPQRQLERAVTSVRELFRYGEGWPFQSIPPVLGDSQSWHQARLWLIMLPGLFSLWLALFLGYYRWQVFLVSLPILGMIAMAVIYSGQPRYLLPFYYHFYILAVPAYLVGIQVWERVWIFQRHPV